MVQFMNETADAYAQIRGDAGHCKIKGNIYFFEMYGGTLVVAEVEGLPNAENAPNANFYGFHIHEEHYVQEMKRIHLLRQRDIIIRKIQYIQGMRGIFLHCLQMRGLHGAPFTQTGFTRKK